MKRPLRIVIADDHPTIRYGLRALLESLPGTEVVGEAANGHQVVKAAASLRPDIVVMDLHMPDLDGIEATRRIVRANPRVHVLVLTMLDDDDSLFAAMRAGARGYLLKGAEQQEIMRAIEAVGSGESIFGPAIAERVGAYFSRAHLDVAAEAFPTLTQRERQVLDLIAHGEDNPSIARRLNLKPKRSGTWCPTS